MATGGLSDVFSKILEKEIKLKRNESVVLHKAKSDKQRKQAASKRKDEDDVEEEEEEEQEMPEIASAAKAKKQKLSTEVEASENKSYRERQTARLQWLREAFGGDEASMRLHSAREKRLRQQVREFRA